MLIDFSVQNFASFNARQEFSMLASTSTKESGELHNIHDVDEFGIKGVLQSAAIFGPNGSGKSNLIKALGQFKQVVTRSLDTVGGKTVEELQPFLIKPSPYEQPIEFEVSFLAEGSLYRYGIALQNNEVREEWLYWTQNSRETLLFHREGQNIEYNKRSFSEAKLFTKVVDGVQHVGKTKPFVPFVSVISQFDGERSSAVTAWFQKLRVISGINEQSYIGFTLNQLKNNQPFREWMLSILRSFHITDMRFVEVPPDNFNNQGHGLDPRRDKTRLRVDLIKTNNQGQSFSIPLELESEGTKKLIFLLGPLYDVITNNLILVIDEFDNKFHTLLSKFIIQLYHQRNNQQSQLLLTCHDTNLLSNDLFRRDQIWFIDKNQQHESELYSLIEYKEHYTRQQDSYSKDYLLGKYGAVPLFTDLNEMEKLLDGQG